MSVVSEIITSDQLHDLWGSGFTVVPRLRHSDPFHVAPHIIPSNRSYQWLPIRPDPLVKEGHDDQWRPVTYEDHDGIFAPFGTTGDVTIQNMKLCWKPKKDVEVQRAKERAAVLNQEQEWARKFGGFTGGARVVSFDGDRANVREISADKGTVEESARVVERAETKTIETTVGIPHDMLDHLSAIYAVRDGIVNTVVRPDRSLDPDHVITKAFYKAVAKNPAAPWWPTLRAIALPYAVEAVRANLKENADVAAGTAAD